MTERRTSGWFPRLVVVVALVAAACGGGDDDTSTTTEALRAPQAIAAAIPSPVDDPPQHVDDTFIGATDANGPYVALVVQGDEALAYACDGKSGDWFGGTVDGDKIVGRSTTGTRVEATRRGDRVEGTLTVGGEEHRFSLRMPTGTDEGLFRETGKDKGRLGWIVLGRDDIRGVVEGPDGKTVAVEEGVSGGSSGSVAPGGSATTVSSTTSTTRSTQTARGVYSPIFKETFGNCDQVNSKRKEIKMLYGVDPQTGEGCTGNKNCEKFRAELNRVGNALGCVVDPFF